jgi:hypothetical protein
LKAKWVSFRRPLTTFISFSGITETRNSANIINTVPAVLAQGYGPGTAVPSSDATGWITIDHSAGRDHVLFVSVRYLGSSNFDASQATFLGAPTPFQTSFRYSGSYQTAKLSRRFGFGTGYIAGTSQTFSLSNSGYASSILARSNSTDIDLGVDRVSGPLTLNAETGLSRDTGGLNAGLMTFKTSATWQGKSTSANLEYQHSASQAQQAFGAPGQVLGAPQTATFDCDAHRAVVSDASILTGQHPTRDLIEAKAVSTLAGGWKVGEGVSVALDHHALVSDFASGDVTVPPSFLGPLNTFFHGTCESNAQLAAGDILATRLVQVPLLRSSQLFITLDSPPRPLRLSAFYETYAEYVAGCCNKERSPRTSVIDHGQLPYVPLHRANALLSYSTANGTLALDLLYTSANNADALPGHVELMLGVARKLGDGVITASVQNVLNAYGGRFATQSYAVPITTSDGPLESLANPIPRTWTLSYHFKLGQKR